MIKAGSKTAPFSHHRSVWRGGPDVPFILSKIVILYRIKGTIIRFPQSSDEGAKKQKFAIWHRSLKWWAGGLDAPFILSKTVASFFDEL